MKLRINEGDYTLFANDYDYNHYTDFEDMHTIYDDDHYDFKELGLTTVEEVANFYKKVRTYQICSREMLLGDLDYNIRKGYWKSSNTPKLLSILDNDPSFEFTVFPIDESKKEFGITERYTRLKEKETPNIEVKHEGILEVPEGKKVDELPYSHFEKLAKKKGLSKITKALNNLQVWNKNDDKELSKWAGNMIDKLNKKLKKDECKESVDFLCEKRSNNKYITSFKRDGITYYIDLFYDAGNTFGQWWDDSDNGLGYNNIGWIGVKNDFGFNYGKFNKDSIKDYIIIDSEYNRPLKKSIQNIMINKIKNLIDYEALNKRPTRENMNKSFKLNINEDLYSIIYDYDDEEGNTYTDEELFKGSWTDLQDLIKKMKSNGCYHIDANAISEEEDFDESLIKESGKKSFWKYYMNDPAIERIENSEYDKFDKNNIKKVKLYSCANEEDCYEDDFSWAVCYYDRPNKAFFGNKEDAYITLMDYLNTSMYEKRNDL